jgi:hypothetical protein
VSPVTNLVEAVLGRDHLRLQVGDRLQRCGLAGTVCSEERNDPALWHLERHALEHEDDVIVDDLDVVNRQI